MIDRTQLAEALARLDPRDREVLDYSLRRHVPDEDLAAVFDCGPGDVARMRARAVERLADDLGVQRGSDLGHVLTALLDQATWGATEAALPRPPATEADPAADGGPASGAATAAPETTEPASETTEPAPETHEPAAAPPQQPAAAPAPPSAPETVPPVAARKEPVLGMLGDDRAAVRSGASLAGAESPGGTGRSWWAVATVLIVALIAVGLGSVVLLGDDSSSTANPEADTGTRPFEPQEDALGDPFPSDPDSAHQYPIAIVEDSIQVYDGPGGRPTLRLGASTEWGSPRVMGVVEQRGEWLAVLLPELDNGEVGWIAIGDVARLDSVAWALKADLGKRTLVVERDGEIVRRMEIGVGREDHPTPTGRFAVTDKLSVSDPNSPYGCCVLALTGHQTRLPVGWPGGDRLAIHATPDLTGLGEAVSLGCLRTDPEDARWMLDNVPLGSPVFITEGAPPPSAQPDSGGATSRDDA